nr:putative rna-dependent rna polymerase 5 [Quercus suber]
MDRDNSFNSTSILGLISDTVNKYQTEDQSIKEVWKLPCFDVEVPEACMAKWKEHYEQYGQDMFCVGCCFLYISSVIATI